MVKQDDAWTLPRRKPITKAILDRATATETARASHEHQARAAWFDPHHDAVLMILTDGRAFGAQRSLIPSLCEASPEQLHGLRATEDGAFLAVAALDLHINVDGLVTRLIEQSPVTIRQAGARLAGQAVSAAKATAAARNGRLGGRPRRDAKAG
ncbi:hypothetical protein ASG60_09630 [Methylobacterium sp. Leaf469]|jgi:hypothetical protein|uniref:DUF2442 domain-containing protein n=1 Tax=unclassified Methylobacterium TaxID=2615210 RepID=UPI0006F5AAA7|nr:MULTISPECIES: DUF2442 domain-containing protein [unclassified Methylobacterium]KQO59325.1 hypothetical protein ASF22_06565 [Methylobacterium sp. Leaf87]KQT89909.1 hypothetical protein ASG60_09630 [Methylobacterium sp. Leaf469]USU34126.1 DUF2442 domain-containing protein [Methylobacterium sp. OTU13CASTA1]